MVNRKIHSIARLNSYSERAGSVSFKPYLADRGQGKNGNFEFSVSLMKQIIHSFAKETKNHLNNSKDGLWQKVFHAQAIMYKPKTWVPKKKAFL